MNIKARLGIATCVGLMAGSGYAVHTEMGLRERAKTIEACEAQVLPAQECIDSIENSDPGSLRLGAKLIGGAGWLALGTAIGLGRYTYDWAQEPVHAASQGQVHPVTQQQ